jgi:predicted GIY-YIG superfamily endonuclease
MVNRSLGKEANLRLQRRAVLVEIRERRWSHTSKKNDEKVIENDDMEVISEEESRNKICDNCQREENGDNRLKFIAVMKENVHFRRRWCFLKKDSVGSTYVVCVECYGYITSPPKKGIPVQFCWPGFVYGTMQECCDGTKVWELLPSSWRSWWIKAARKIECLRNVSIDHPHSMVEDGTNACLTIKGILNDLQNTSWIDFKKGMEEFQSIPLVRCPWGCSEFFGCVNEKRIALDVFWQWYLDRSLVMYSAKKDTYCTEGFRKDIVSKPAFILDNPNWKCKIHYFFPGGSAPGILICRYHAPNHILRYIHPPTNPTGSMSFDGDNTTAEVVVVPRTVKAFQANKFTHSYQINKVMGTYSGLDSLNLTDVLDYNKEKALMSTQRDMIAYRGRADYRNFIQNIRRKNHFVSKNDVIGFIDKAESMFSSDEMSSIKEFHGNGATYVPIQDVFELASFLKTQSSRTILIYEEENEKEVMKNFTSRWPRRLIPVCDAGSRYGRSFRLFTGLTKKQDGLLWYLINMIHMIPVLWKNVDSTVKSNRGWEGYVLSMLLDKVLPSRGLTTGRNPFPKKKCGTKEIVKRLSTYYSYEDGKLSVINTFRKWFNENKKIGIFDHSCSIKDFASFEMVIIICSDHTNLNFKIHDDKFGNNKWELRFIGIPGNENNTQECIYVKHKGEDMLFWQCDRKGNKVLKCKDTVPVLLQSVRKIWEILVFVATKSCDFDAIRENMIHLQQGQVRLHCKKHAYPLIITAVSRHNRLTCCFRDDDCKKCKLKCHLECPNESCEVCVCRKHFKLILDDKERSDIVNVDKDLGILTDVFDDDEKEDSVFVNSDDSSSQELSSECSSSGLSYVNENEEEDIDIESFLEDVASLNSQESLLHDMKTWTTEETEDPGFDFNFDNDDNESKSSEAEDMEIDNDTDDEEVEMDGMDTESSDMKEDYANLAGPEDLRAHNNEAIAEESTANFVIPTTNPAKERCGYNVSTLAAQGKLIPNHVLLNNSGSCLLRHNVRLKASQRNRSFLQRLIATSKGRSVPLLYAEGTLFPNTFWLEQSDGSMIGAIPSVLLQDNRTLNNIGIAGLYDHCRTRILDPTLLTSTSHQSMAFGWDQCANLGLRGNNTIQVLRRGFADVIKDEGIRMKDEEDRVYDKYVLDSKSKVNQVAAANAKHQNELFFTWTCCAKKTLCVRILSTWVESEEAVEYITSQYRLKHGFRDWDDLQEKELTREALRMSSGALILRCWMELVQTFLRYLREGKDSPFTNVCGGLVDFWNRVEIQSEEDGKVPHCHTLLYFRKHPVNDEERFELLNMIRACMSTFLSESEKQELIDKGFVEEPDMIEGFLQDAESFLTHYCTRRCQVLSRVVNEEGHSEKEFRKRCKAPDHRRMSDYPPDHDFKHINVQHSTEAIEIMFILGLIQSASASDVIPEKAFLHLFESKRHIPPCYSVGRPRSPANPFLFAMLLSAMNLQYCTSYLLLRYLAKYVASLDKSCKVIIKGPEKSDERVFRVDISEGYNTKISSNRLAEETKEKNEKDKRLFRLVARVISLAELLMQILQYATIYTTLKFEYIPTQPMALRPIIKQKAHIEKMKSKGIVKGNVSKPSDLNTSRTFAGYKAREDMEMPPWRQYDDFQVISHQDSIFQPGSLDKVTIFGLRPPELRFLKRITKYYTWFTREPVNEIIGMDMPTQIDALKKRLDISYRMSYWIDGLGYKVQIRRKAISKLLAYIRDIPQQYTKCDFGSENARKEVTEFFEELEYFCDNEDVMETRRISERQNVLTKMFLEESVGNCNTKIPIYWFFTPRCSMTERFLYHLLISLGSFSTELEFLSQGSFKKCFIHTRLFTSSNDQEIQETSARDLIRKFVVSQLAHLPMGTRTFDNELMNAKRTIWSVLIDDKIVSDSLPSALFTKIREETNEECRKYYYEYKARLTQNILKHVESCFTCQLPLFSDIEKASIDCPVDFDITSFPIADVQSTESYKEHQNGLNKVIELVRHYKLGTIERTKSLCFVGAGGVGKTMDLRIAGLYCLCQGLFVISSSLTGKRSADMGGEHLHVRFKLAVNEQVSIVEAAEKAIVELQRDPKRWDLLCRMDVLLLDELGQINAQLLTILDMILRRIRKSTHWFGGILVFTTMDVRQLKPIHGLPPLLCPSMTSSFLYQKLDIPLRTNDPSLCAIQAITRMSKKQLTENPEIKRTFFALIGDHCNFINDVKDSRIPLSGTIYCFAKHGPCQRAEKEVLRRAQQRFKGLVTSRKAIDWEMGRHQRDPVLASTVTSDCLDNKTKPPRELLFFPYATYEFTFNDPGGKFFQSQIAMVLEELPSEQVLEKWKPITIFRAPHGIDEIPPFPILESELIEKGWIKVQVGKHPERMLSLGHDGLCGMREQYGLRHHIATTIHGIMGATVSFLVTEIGRSLNLSLWEAAQVVVLLSRTRRAKDIYFIGSKTEVIEALWDALLIEDQFSSYITYLLKKLCDEEEPEKAFVIDQANEHPFRPIDIPLPMRKEYCSYILVSLKDTSFTYIGSTMDLSKRINQHNSYHGGSKSTNHNMLKPWALLGYVVGFNNKQQAMSFEGYWKATVRDEQVRTKNNLNCMQRAELAKDVQLGRTLSGLKLVLCGNLVNKEEISIPKEKRSRNSYKDD